jgi:hypothetical protein
MEWELIKRMILRKCRRQNLLSMTLLILKILETPKIILKVAIGIS